MQEKERFMRAALARARKGLAQGEVPVGAVVVCDGKIVGSGYNRRTRTQMEDNPRSAMWTKYTSETANGKTAFDFYHDDIDAKEVVDWYIKYLACGLANLANIFRPEIIMIGGGVSEQGDNLTVPLQTYVDKELFGGTSYAPVKTVKASLGSKAGAYGAAALAMNYTV